MEMVLIPSALPRFIRTPGKDAAYISIEDLLARNAEELFPGFRVGGHGVFRVLREFNLKLIKSLKPEELERYGMHAERGKESVAHYTRMMAGHDLNHLAQVEGIVRDLRKR